MSTQPTPPFRSARNRLSTFLGRVERLVVRPLAVFATFLLCVFAVVQVAGRVVVHAVPDFEGRINNALASRSIVVSGLAARWHGFNPILTAARVDFPAGYVRDVVVEVDILESAWHSAFVPRVARVGDAEVHAEKTPQGWRLVGMGTEPLDIDIESALAEGDDLRAGGMLVLHDRQDAGLGTEALLGTIAIANHGADHYIALGLANAANPDDEIDFELWRHDRRWPTDPATSAASADGVLTLPRILTGMASARVTVNYLGWRDTGERGGGLLEAQVSGLKLAAGEHALGMQITLDAERTAAGIEGRTSAATLRVAGEELALGPIYLLWDRPDQQPLDLASAAQELVATPQRRPLLRAWIERIALGEVTALVSEHMADWGRAGSWIEALAIHGEARNVQAYVDPDLGFGYSAQVQGLSMQGYRGAPEIARGHGAVYGYGRGVAFVINARDAFLKFPALYHDGWEVQEVAGTTKAWFGPGYVGLQGAGLHAVIDGAHVDGGFAVTRPNDRYEQRVSLHLGVDATDVARGRDFIPYKIPEALATWLEDGPRAGALRDARLAYHGQVHVRPSGDPAPRRLELIADVLGGDVIYDKRWPAVTALDATVHVAGREVRADVRAGRSRDINVAEAQVTLHDNARYATARLRARPAADAALAFVRTTPLKENMSFVMPAWEGTGRIDLDADLVVPLQPDDGVALQADIDFSLDDVGLTMPEYRMHIDALAGRGHFTLPHHLSGEFSGALFGREAKFLPHSTERWLIFDVSGSATPNDVYDLIAYEDTAPVAGAFDFTGALHLAMQGGVTHFEGHSDLVGLTIDLPGEFGKVSEEVVPSEVGVQFLAQHQSVRFNYKRTDGWLHVGEEVERGAIGVGKPPPMTAHETEAIMISGSVDEIVLEDWVGAEGDAAVSLPVDWIIRDLSVGAFTVDELTYADVLLRGQQSGDDVAFGFDGPAVEGDVSWGPSGPIALNLVRLDLPLENSDGDAGAELDVFADEDPLDVEVGYALPAARVNIDALLLEGEPFGSWRFEIVPGADEVSFVDLSADVNGVHIEESRVHWDLAANRSSFEGQMLLDDLAETLPKWDYAPSLQTDEASLTANASWPGSPPNVALLGLRGDLTFAASDGRFLDVQAGQGGMRILSLVNFANITKRISLDFSDVTGEGIEFRTLLANVRMNEGIMTFPERMLVDSPGSNFQFGGRVDLATGILDNEMIVTLPVNESLPWYGFYLAFVNPLAGLGVILGERVLRKPIEQFSSAKFVVTGTMEEPNVNFVSLWDKSMREDGQVNEVNDVGVEGEISDDDQEPVADLTTQAGGAAK